jgi:hypothetical protein
MVGAFLKWLTGQQPALAPSLYEVVPHASMLPRSLPHAEVVLADEIGGTTRHPSNTTADFLPIPVLRSQHWQDNWRRMLEAHERNVLLPPIELLKVGSRYFVVDGHKRVAAARRMGAAVDAIVVDLYPPASPCVS